VRKLDATAHIAAGHEEPALVTFAAPDREERSACETASGEVTLCGGSTGLAEVVTEIAFVARRSMQLARPVAGTCESATAADINSTTRPPD
jgi:hypothetical protein